MALNEMHSDVDKVFNSFFNVPIADIFEFENKLVAVCCVREFLIYISKPKTFCCFANCDQRLLLVKTAEYVDAPL